MLRCLLAIGIAGWLGILCTCGQGVLTRHFDPLQGFPASTVYRVLPFAEGTVWFGTNNGLVYYNGQDYETFTFTDSIYHNAVLALRKAGTEGLWVGLYRQGLYRFQDGQLEPWDCTSPESKQLLDVVQDKSGVLWGITKWQQLIRYENKKPREVLPEGQVRELLLERDTLWVTTIRGLQFRPPNDTVFQTLPGTEHLSLHSARRDIRGRWWLLTESAVYLQKRSKAVRIDIPGISWTPFFIQPDATGALWICDHQQGMHRWYPGSDRTYRIEGIPANTHVNRMYSDALGQVWIASEDRGTWVGYALEHIQVYPIPQVQTLAVDDSDDLWAGNFGRVFQIHDGQVIPVTLPDLAAAEQIKYFGPGPDGWVAGSSSQSWWLPPGKQWKKLPERGGLLGMAHLHDRSWWCGRYNGITQYDTITNTKTPFYSEYLFGNRIDALASGPNGALWAGGEGKLYQLTEQDTTLWTELQGMPQATVTELHWQADTLWIATNGGLLRWVNDTLHRYTAADGLPHPTCHALAEDGYGRMWVATDGGLAVRKDHRWKRVRWDAYQLTDRPKDLAVQHGHLLWVAYPEKLLCVNLNRLDLFPEPPALSLSLRNSLDSVFIPPVQLARRDAASLRLDLHVHAWDHARLWQTEYRLPPLQTHWSSVPEGHALLGTLPAGSYAIESRMRNRITGATGSSISLRLVILPPWYQSPIALSGGALALAGLLIGFFRWRLKTVRQHAMRKLTHERHIHRLHHRALTQSLHPHALTNALQTLQQVLLTQSHDQGTRYVQRLTRWIRMNLEDAQNPYVSLEQEWKRLELYLQLEQSRFGSHLQFQLTQDPELDLSEHLIPGMVIQPIVENALIHGIRPLPQGGKVSLHAEPASESRVRVTVEDTGRGWQAGSGSTSRTSLGMGLVREKLDWTGRPYSLDTEVMRTPKGTVRGTRVTLLLPSLEPEAISVASEVPTVS